MGEGEEVCSARNEVRILQCKKGSRISLNGDRGIQHNFVTARIPYSSAHLAAKVEHDPKLVTTKLWTLSTLTINPLTLNINVTTHFSNESL